MIHVDIDLSRGKATGILKPIRILNLVGLTKERHRLLATRLAGKLWMLLPIKESKSTQGPRIGFD